MTFLGYARTALRAIGRDLRNWRRRAAAIAELERYDDHQLSDIGISRGAISDYVDGALSTPPSGLPADSVTRGAAAPNGQGATVIPFPVASTRNRGAETCCRAA